MGSSAAAAANNACTPSHGRQACRTSQTGASSASAILRWVAAISGAGRASSGRAGQRADAHLVQLRELDVVALDEVHVRQAQPRQGLAHRGRHARRTAGRSRGHAVDVPACPRGRLQASCGTTTMRCCCNVTGAPRSFTQLLAGPGTAGKQGWRPGPGRKKEGLPHPAARHRLPEVKGFCSIAPNFCGHHDLVTRQLR